MPRVYQSKLPPIDEIMRLAQTHTQWEVADMFGVTAAAVSFQVRQAGLKWPRTVRGRTDVETQALWERAQNGERIADLAAEKGLKPSALYERFRRRRLLRVKKL